MKDLKKILWFARENKRGYLIGALSLLVTYIFIPIPNWVIGRFIDLIRANSLDLKTFRLLSVAILGSIVFQYIFEYIWHYNIFGLAFQSARDFRRRIVAKVLGQAPNFFIKNSTGSIMSKATNDISAIETLTGYGVLAFFDSTVYPISIMFIMAITVSWKLTLISILAMPIIIVVTKKLGKILIERALAIQKSFEKLNESVLENVSSIRVIKGFSTQEITQERFDERADELFRNQMKQAKQHALFIPTTRIVPAICFVVALIFGELFIGMQEISLGQLVSFFMYLNMLSWPMIAFGDLINVIQEASSALSRIQEIFDYKEDLVDREGAVDYKALGDIEFIDFDFSYPGEDRLVLNKLNLKIERGKTLGVVGKIGSGKTTLLKQLLRYYEVRENSLLFDGKSVENYKIKSIRDKMGYVSQQHILFSKSVRENILFGNSKASEEEFEAAIDFADFRKDIKNLPQELETMIGEKGISISGGQKQRISIARAIIKEPEILILDDSLSAVDALTEKNIIERIKEEREGKTTIIIAHRLSGLKHADKIIVLEEGHIVEEGSHEELLANKAWYFDQYQAQSMGGSDGKVD